MAEQFLVVEVLDPTSVQGVMNVYINLDREEHEVRNGFKALKESGMFPTGTVTRMERVAGEMRRVGRFPVQRAFEQGFRTMSAFLRA